MLRCARSSTGWWSTSFPIRRRTAASENACSSLSFSRAGNTARQPFQVVAHDLEKVGPLLRVGDVAARAAAERGLEVEQRREDQKPLGPGVALERDVQAPAHRAAPAVAADHIVEDMLLRAARSDTSAGGVLRHIGDARAKPQLDIAHRGEPPQTQLAELVLLGLDDEWIGRLVAQHL